MKRSMRIIRYIPALMLLAVFFGSVSVGGFICRFIGCFFYEPGAMTASIAGIAVLALAGAGLLQLSGEIERACEERFRQRYDIHDDDEDKGICSIEERE